MYRNQPWTVEDVTTKKTKKKQSRREGTTKRGAGVESVKSLVLDYVKKNPSMIFDTKSIMKVMGCQKNTASKVIAELHNSKKIKLVKVYKNRAMLYGGYQSNSGDMDSIKLTKNKTYVTISSYLKSQGMSTPAPIISAIRDILAKNGIQPELSLTRGKLTLVYAMRDLRSALWTYKKGSKKVAFKNKDKAQEVILETVKATAKTKETSKTEVSVKKPLSFKFFGKTINITIQ